MQHTQNKKTNKKLLPSLPNMSNSKVIYGHQKKYTQLSQTKKMLSKF